MGPLKTDGAYAIHLCILGVIFSLLWSSWLPEVHKWWWLDLNFCYHNTLFAFLSWAFLLRQALVSTNHLNDCFHVVSCSQAYSEINWKVLCFWQYQDDRKRKVWFSWHWVLIGILVIHQSRKEHWNPFVVHNIDHSFAKLDHNLRSIYLECAII